MEISVLAINWFEVLLSDTVAEIPVEHLAAQAPIPRRKKSIEYRTLTRNADDNTIVYHITASLPQNTTIEEVDFEENPSLARYAIEHGFAARLRETGFEVRLRHVGGVGYRIADTSPLPDIYQPTAGVEFRCFYGFNRDEPQRWGLILNYTSGQRFTVSLADETLQSLALGKRVVPFDHDSAKESLGGKEVNSSLPYSGILESVDDKEAIIVDNDGFEHSILLEQWTLQSRRDNLLDYVRNVKDEKAASMVATRLQQDALTLTPKGRMNTALAKDQLQRLQTIMVDHDLLTFRLPLPNKLSARVVKEPLIVGDDR